MRYFYYDVFRTPVHSAYYLLLLVNRLRFYFGCIIILQIVNHLENTGYLFTFLKEVCSSTLKKKNDGTQFYYTIKSITYYGFIFYGWQALVN